MQREKFVANMTTIETPMSAGQLRQYVYDRARMDDLPVCLGSLNKLGFELSRFQRDKMDMDDFLQELAHAQWAVWRLLLMFDVSDEELRRAMQASFDWQEVPNGQD